MNEGCQQLFFLMCLQTTDSQLDHEELHVYTFEGNDASEAIYDRKTSFEWLIAQITQKNTRQSIIWIAEKLQKEFSNSWMKLSCVYSNTHFNVT